RQRARVRRRRLVEVADVDQHVAELRDELRRVRSVGLRLQLQLEELLDHVQLPEVPVDEARRLEALDERGVQLVGVLEMLQRLDARQELAFEDATEAQVE